ncbi:hypothetical protein F5882DRAFT_470734 [Hyaloscypha sp. PMI_1271]|nr:hypothetical protein F5882DRAFT_470734 [Hyaloscypha sp. PMI_1271]
MNPMTNTQFPKVNSSPFVFTANVPNIAETSATAAPKDAHPFVFADGTTPVIVTYKNDRVVGKVSPHAMALASPVWKKFIFPPFPQRSMKDTTEPKGSKIVVEPVEELDFAEDPAEALLILLNITHFRFTGIPTTLPLNILSEIAILCDQYDCVHLAKPWLPQWLANENSEWKSTDPTPTTLAFGAPPATPREKWLFIAWVFGREQVLKDLASLLVREISTYKNGTCAALAGNYGPMPPGLIESILLCRRVTIAKLLAITAKCASPFTNDPNALHCPYRNRACDAIMYGSLLRGLEIAKVTPMMNAEEYHNSVETLSQGLSNLVIHVHPPYYGAYVAQDHSNCFTTDIKKEVEAVMAGIGDPILKHHIRHVEAQRSKLN